MPDPLNAVLVGCGGISRTWLRAIADIPEVRLVALVDLNRETARSRASEFDMPNVHVSDSLEATLNRFEPEVVFDCTVPSAHHGVTLMALAHGCHVLGEKPLADTLSRAQEMVAVAKASGRLYAVMQNRRYDANIRRLRAFLESGAIGRITTANCDFYIGAHFGGFRDTMPHVLLVDMAIHTFDAARFITGTSAVSVYCKEWNPPGSWYARDASAVAVFQMTDDVVYTYRGSWCAEGLNTTWESHWHIIGESGSVMWDGADGFRAEVVEAAGGFHSILRAVDVPMLKGLTKVGGHAGAIREFVHCVQNGGVPETICSDNIHSLAMVFGAVASAESGRVIELEG